MSEAKHTPGPWIAENSCSGKAPDAGAAVIASNDDLKISNPSRGTVAWATRRVGMSSSETIANARLIASAPELLAALKGLVKCTVNPYHHGEFEDGEFPPLDSARAAIAQAEAEL